MYITLTHVSHFYNICKFTFFSCVYTFFIICTPIVRSSNQVSCSSFHTTILTLHAKRRHFQQTRPNPNSKDAKRLTKQSTTQNQTWLSTSRPVPTRPFHRIVKWLERESYTFTQSLLIVKSMKSNPRKQHKRAISNENEWRDVCDISFYV